MFRIGHTRDLDAVLFHDRERGVGIAFQSITTRDFVAYVNDHLFLGDPIAKSIDLTAWLSQPGLPAGFAEPKSDRLAAIDQTARGWLDGSCPKRLRSRRRATRVISDVDRPAQADRAALPRPRRHA